MQPAPDPWDDPTPMWLSHHWPDEYDRCVRVGDKLVCRRCLVLYPLSLVTAVVAGFVGWPASLDGWLLWVLPLPAVLEFVAEQLRLVRHSPTRLVVVTVPLALACGRMYVRYLEDQRDGLVWSVVSTYLLVCVSAFFIRAFTRRAT